MQVSFGSKEKQIEFFEKVKPNNMSWRQFYKIINDDVERRIPRRTYRNWHEGRNLPPLEIIKTVCYVFNQKLDNSQIEILPKNWGVILGGKRKVKLYGCNLTKEQKIKGGKRSGNTTLQKFGNKWLYQISSQGGAKSLKTKNNFRRKITGPKGEKMFNKLEKEVAEILLDLKLGYEYEKILKIGKHHIIPDFVVNDNVVIECSYYSWIEKKVQELRKRIQLILRHTNMNKIILVTNLKLKEKYDKHIGNIITVLTPRELPEWFMTEY